MVYQVGRPAILEGNRFLPETGTPIWKMVRNSTVLELWEPEPFTVATWMLMSLTTGLLEGRPACWIATSVVAMGSFLLLYGTGMGLPLWGNYSLYKRLRMAAKPRGAGEQDWLTARTL